MATFTIVQPRYDDALLKRTTKFNTDKERMSSALVAQLFPKVSYVGRANALRRQRLLIGRDASRGHKVKKESSLFSSYILNTEPSHPVIPARPRREVLISMWCCDKAPAQTAASKMPLLDIFSSVS